MPPEQAVDGEVSQEEIEKIYEEVDAKAPVEENSEENVDSAAKSAEEQTESTETKSQEEEQAAADKAAQDQAAAELAATELKDRAVKLGLAETATLEEVEAKEKDAGTAEEVEPADDVIQAHAVKHSMTYAEAKADIKANQAVLKNYKSPEEIARALRSTQREYSKLKEQTEKKPEQMFQRMPDQVFITQAKEHFTKDVNVETGENVHVARFRKAYPGRGETMTDEGIIELLADNALNGYKKFADQKEGEVKTVAKKKRDDALASLDPNDRQFLPDVKAILDVTGDREVLHKDFDIEDLVRHARGEKTRYQAAIKVAEERGFKRGSEKAEILGTKPGAQGSTPKKGAGSTGTTLNTEQKERAEEMFPVDRGYTKDQAYSEFQKTYANELKKDKNFLY